MKDISYWMDTCKEKQFPPFSGEIKCEAVIIGGGLTGITTALLLSLRGMDVILLEADRLGSGTTGNTTAKITVQHGLCFSHLAREKALAYAKVNRAGLSKIESLVKEYNIDCDFCRLPSYVYTRNGSETDDIEKEAHAYQELGISGETVSSAPLPFEIKSAVVMDDQAQFHPLKYLYALADIIGENGGVIYEQSKVVDIEKGEKNIVYTNNGNVTADIVILATNYPPIDFPGLFFIKLHQERSYIISTDAKKTDVRGMYINAGNPVNSIRMHYGKGENQLLLGGYGHKTAYENEKKSGYSNLEDFLHTDFKRADDKANHRWAAQDCVTLDGLPYIGTISKTNPNIFVATGYAKWGMTNSAAAAMIIEDCVTGSNNIEEQARAFFSPSRFTPAASAKNFLIQSGDTLKEFTAGNVKIPIGDYDDISPGKGAVLRINGRAQAVYKDESGRIYTFKARCTHLGCPLEYNEAEKSFDCPCHGSRFSYLGKVIEGPAKQGLEKVAAEDEDF